MLSIGRSAPGYRSHSCTAVRHSGEEAQSNADVKGACPMPVMLLRAKVKAENVADVEAAVTTMFSAINQAEPKGVRYASCKVANSAAVDGATFVILLELEDGAENPLAAVPAFREFQQGLANWLAEPPIPEQLTVVGSYNLF
jgi:hypothetical protein